MISKKENGEKENGVRTRYRQHDGRHRVCSLLLVHPVRVSADLGSLSQVIDGQGNVATMNVSQSTA